MLKTYGPLLIHAVIGLAGAAGFTIDPVGLAKIGPVLIAGWMVVAIIMHIPAISRALAEDLTEVGLSPDDIAQIAKAIPAPADPSAAIHDLANAVQGVIGKPVIDPALLDKLGAAADLMLAAAPAKTDNPPAKDGATAGAGTGPAVVAAQPGATQPQPVQQAQARHRIAAFAMMGFLVAGLFGLSACASLSDPTTAIVTVESAYAAAVSAEILWLNSGTADAATVAKVEALRLTAHNALAPLATEAGAGTAPSSDLILAAQAAVDALVAAVPTTPASATPAPATGAN